jgi:uncharacterized protein with LGFP repeats
MTRAHEQAPAWEHTGCAHEPASLHDAPAPAPEFELTRRALLGAAAGAAAAGLALPTGVQARQASSDGELAPHMPAPAKGPWAAAAPATIPQTLPTGPGQPAIVEREAWALGRCPPAVAPEYGTVKLGFVHHTENPNGYEAGAVPAMLRAIYQFHRYGRGWNDIGYNFLVDRFGRIFEARAGGFDAAVVGAHAGGYNYCSTGVAVLGEYGAVDISPAAQAALAHLVAWKLSLHGTPLQGRVTVRVNPAGAVYSRFPANARVSLPRVAGHRDADSTECPGNALYGELGAVRQGAAGLAGAHAALASLLLAQGTGTAGATAELRGSLTLLNGTPIAGAPIEIQVRTVARRGELVQQRTLASTLTAANGEWSLPLAPTTAEGKAQWLRALCPGAPGVPAAVSDPLRLPGTLTLAPPPTAPSPSAEQPPAQ